MAKLISPVGRVSYPSVFKPNVFEGKESYQLSLLIDKNDPILNRMRAEAEAAAKEKWPKGIPNKFNSPFVDGDTLEGNPEEAKGKIRIKFSTSVDRKPQVVGPDLKEIDPTSGDFYAGCFAKVSYTVYAYDNKSKGVKFSLNNVQKVRDGEPLDGRTKADDDFEAFEQEAGKLAF